MTDFMHTTESIDRLFLELSQFTRATTAKELALRAALLKCARQAEALKRECGMDPESAQAVRNAQYQAISTTAHIALGTIRGPEAPNLSLYGTSRRPIAP